MPPLRRSVWSATPSLWSLRIRSGSLWPSICCDAQKLLLQKVGHWIANGPQCSRCAVVVGRCEVAVQCSDRTATAQRPQRIINRCGRCAVATLDHRCWERAKRSGRYKHELGQSTAITQRFIIRCGRLCCRYTRSQMWERALRHAFSENVG